MEQRESDIKIYVPQHQKRTDPQAEPLRTEPDQKPDAPAEPQPPMPVCR
ncbi:MAG: hypothetical protein IKI77_12945 [Oscillospiraceae bacterium]|nr:hypothetical protein [Oscillospiraceae bacterium]